ncbi:MAG: hypothetical protein C4567_16965 [Deltaproteobacteria bacterium]|nr:MAG: hypothetical protein C4567_16965 [Deltaproteobacteria bacterium]
MLFVEKNVNFIYILAHLEEVYRFPSQSCMPPKHMINYEIRIRPRLTAAGETIFITWRPRRSQSPGEFLCAY